MNKPTLRVKKYDDWGRPQYVSNFMNDSQLHTAWEDWAKTQRYNEILVVVTVFADGSHTQDEFNHVTKTITYKDYEHEEWEVEIETTKTKWAIDDPDDAFLEMELQSATKNQIIAALHKFYAKQKFEIASIIPEIHKIN